MRLCTFDRRDGDSRAGILGGEAGAERVLDLGAVAGRPIRDLGALVDMHPELTPETLFRRLAPLEDLAVRDGTPLRDVRLLAPVLRPPKVTCLGLNYKDHAMEHARKDVRVENGPSPKGEAEKAKLPDAPLLFAKARTAVSGPAHPILLQPGREKVDYEVELCLVVGHGGFRIAREHARAHLLGYTVAIDVSDREAQFGDKQWYRGKSAPTFCPTGPALVSADALDPGRLRLTTRLNGNVMQDGTTADLIFGVDEIVAYVSAATPLEPGDLILTGTPAGVGVFREPPVFLRAGDRLVCAIEGIGALDLAIESASA